MDQNTKIDILSNNTIISNTYIDYKRTNSRCTQPEKNKVCWKRYGKTESYTYTNLNDIASYKITDKNGTVLSNIEYKYDYEI